jgi:hypothetical protein
MKSGTKIFTCDQLSSEAHPLAEQEHSCLNFDNKETLGRICVEVLLYISILCRAFGWQLGILKIERLSGAIIIISGLVCLGIIIYKREHIPRSIFFAFIIGLLAYLSELISLGLGKLLVSLGPVNMLFWMSTLLMACYVVRNDRAALRFALFLAGCVFFAVSIGGTTTGVGGYTEYWRLRLERGEVATMFANANALAQVCYMVVIALLFFSLRCTKVIKAICWICALGLSVIVLMTLSRQGLILLGLGIFFYLTAVMVGKGGKIGLILLLVLAIMVASKYMNELMTIKQAYGYRFGIPSGRFEFWLTAPHDMMDTLIIGKGTSLARTSQGLQPHNTFLWLHLAYGGLCAWIYAAWIFWLSVKVWQLFWFRKIEWRLKMEVTAMFTIFFLCQLTGVFAPGNYGIILATAIVEKYITPFSGNHGYSDAAGSQA